jgi:hypothetical protein
VPKEKLMDSKRFAPAKAVLLPGQRGSTKAAGQTPSSHVEFLVTRLGPSRGPRVLA